MKYLLIFTLFITFNLNLLSKSFHATPDNYTSFLNSLQPGDSLFLSTGIFKNGLTLNNVNGTKESPIIITGIDTATTIFEGRDGANTVSLTKCSFLIIKKMKIDGKGYGVDAVKAEGTTGNFVHDITLENLVIINHGANQQIVGISTKCTAWNCVIRNNKIIGAGTGLYLGNSDGTAPFVNGIIEYNCVLNSLGYNMEIKQQNDSLRIIPGMVLNGKTIIRYNVFSKKDNYSTGGSARPCLLTGNFPSTGDGANDIYEIYGNVFYQNPTEALFQGTGNIAFYSNVLVNNYDPSGLRAVYFTQQNNIKCRNIYVFHNTVLADNSSGGIRMYNADKNYKQYCWANAVFAPSPAVSNFASQLYNMTDTYENAGKYISNPADSNSIPDLFPVTGKMQDSAIDISIFKFLDDWDRDFNGNLYSVNYRGAYSGSGTNNGWKLQLDIRPQVTTQTGVIDPKLTNDENIFIYPNPASDKLNLPDGKHNTIQIYTMQGIKILETNYNKIIDVSSLSSGIYILKMDGRVVRFVKL